MPNRIVFGGPKNCGKSTLASRLFVELTNTCGPAFVGIHEVDVFSDTVPCILGKKDWSKRQKRRGSDADIHDVLDVRIKEYHNDQHPVVIGDLPCGIMDHFLEKMVTKANFAVVVGLCYMSLREWEEYFIKKNIPVIARVISHTGQLPLFPENADIILATRLNRTHDPCDCTKALAVKIRTLFSSESLTQTG